MVNPKLHDLDETVVKKWLTVQDGNAAYRGYHHTKLEDALHAEAAKAYSGDVAEGSYDGNWDGADTYGGAAYDGYDWGAAAYGYDGWWGQASWPAYQDSASGPSSSSAAPADESLRTVSCGRICLLCL